MDDEEENSAGNSLVQAGQKRKRTPSRRGGCIANGEDFWSQVDAWFVDEIVK